MSALERQAALDALASACELIEDLADQQAMPDDFYVERLNGFRRLLRTNDCYQEPMPNGEPHPLRDVPQKVLDVAREALHLCHDAIVNDDVDPVADFIVLRLRESGFIAL